MKALLARAERHRAVGDLGRQAGELADPRRDRERRAAEPACPETAADGRTRLAGGVADGRFGRALQAGEIDLAGVNIDRDGRRAAAVDAEHRLAGQLRRADLERRHLDLEAAALGQGLGIQRIGPTARHRERDVRPEDADIRPFAGDLQVGALDADAALDRDLATAKTALHVDVAGHAAHPAVERADRAGELDRRGARRADLRLHLQRLVGGVGLKAAARRSRARPAAGRRPRGWSGSSCAPRWCRSRGRPDWSGS